MKKMLLLLFGLAAVWSVAAKVTLPDAIGSNMVLQQNTDVRLWGWADPHAAVKVAASWGAKASAKSDGEGRWEVTLKTPAGSYEPQRITVASGDKRVLDNVLIGEVWFCSGQSNMDMPLGGYWNGLIEGGNEVIACADAQRDRIRFLKVAYSQGYTPQDRVPGAWNEFTTATAARCSATAYFFAEMLSRALNVPVGVIDSSWGGSRIECWTPRAALETYPDIDLDEKAVAELPDYMRPMAMYNAMVYPLTRYTVRGFLWYQGESNIGRHTEYAARMADMVAGWRAQWGLGELPFYFVEIAPFGYGNGLSPYLREAQCRAQALIPGSGMVSTNDLVLPCEEGNIHPRDKRSVGRRLAFWALNRTYGRKDVACENMQFRAMEIRDGKVFLSFDNTFGGFGRAFDLRGFEICGPDRVFRPAQVHFEGNERLIVFLPDIPEPVAVRYGFRDFQPGNVVNTRELPLVPFRTDDF